jgi:hypothetical protein
MRACYKGINLHVYDRKAIQAFFFGWQAQDRQIEDRPSNGTGQRLGKSRNAGVLTPACTVQRYQCLPPAFLYSETQCLISCSAATPMDALFLSSPFSTLNLEINAAKASTTQCFPVHKLISIVFDPQLLLTDVFGIFPTSVRFLQQKPLVSCSADR